MKNKKIVVIIDLIFWTIVIGNIIHEVLKAINGGSININMLGEREYSNSIIFFVLIILFYTIVALLKMFFIVALYVGFRILYKKYFKEKLDKNDFENKDYYRDVILKYSPSVLSFIDDFKLDEKDIVATLLSLQLKQKIKIDKNISLIDDSEDGLEENEKFILNRVKDNSLNHINMFDFKDLVIKDCLNNNLLEKRTNIKKKIIKKIIICILIYFFVISIFKYFPILFNSMQINNNIMLIILLSLVLINLFVMTIYPITTIIYIRTYYFMNKIDPYIRNKKGKEINKKLEGLRKYIKDYSLLNQKKYNDLIIWDNYLIYSVILGENTNITKKIMDMIKVNNNITKENNERD